MADRHLIKPTQRTRLARLRDRGSYDRAVIDAILDEALYCHVGFVADKQPYVVPTIHARVGETLYVHGSVASRMLKNLSRGIEVCLTVTLLDGLVLARSAFHHSMNYRSVLVLGRAALVTDEDQKRAALTALVNRVLPGRAAEVRGPNRKELNATSVLSLPITEVSAKIRRGPPVDAEADYALPCWAGVLPLALMALPAQPDPRLPTDTPVPQAVTAWSRGAGRMLGKG
ncbi:MAG: pyridoxamine 5'-phosphate oxidase family protein [Proteobacteria bacterium]|nr:pyridoxamine 5'-phosphate oxidase family protein [Pseudomonadota bacterium]